MVDMSEFASVLRSWRDRVRPEEVGLPAGPGRRTPGLRREELAALAGVSVDYVVRLEQGRALNPSPQLLGALATALRLTAAERDHLCRVAGVAPRRSRSSRGTSHPGCSVSSTGSATSRSRCSRRRTTSCCGTTCGLR
ncbi:helix-turn-helix domain-containing protein [Curtobacterium sp. 24E2]